MPTPQIVRPGAQLGQDRKAELARYLMDQWRRAKSGRADQVDSKYDAWQKAYSGVPLEEIRTVPFYKSSNFVVKLIRMFLDTFQARSVNIIYATKPLFVCDGMPQEIKDAWELYLNKKALYDWDYYILTKQLAMQGNKNGTAVIKTPYVEYKSWEVQATSSSTFKETEIVEFSGPESSIIPFDDFYLYPITAPSLRCAEILFHKIRYIEEKARRMEREGLWTLPEGQSAETFLRHPKDVQRETEQTDAGVVDPYLREMEVIESHLKWAMTNDSTKLYNVVGLLEPTSGQLVDVYYNPYPENLCIFNDYRPFPRDDIFYGESLSEILGQSQEEASRIHNERRDNSTIASSVCFKRRSGSLLPNPSTNWYPGKVWDLEDMTDLDVFEIGRNYDDMIQQEDYVFQLSEKLSGIGEMMQGASQGMLGKRGVYNTGGTLSVIAEGNQRQDTNIRDLRCVLSCTARIASRLQATYGRNDPLIETLPQEAQEGVKQALELFASPRYRHLQLEVKASSSGANAEIRKANLMMMGQTLAQYGQQAVQMSQQLVDPKLNPSIRLVMNDFINMQRWMAKRLLKELDEWDATEIIPDVLAAIQTSVPGGGNTTKDAVSKGAQADMESGGIDNSLPPLSRSSLEAVASIPQLNGANAPNGSMAPR